ncbi:type II toxin-antitoxin system VapC family toxin [Uliginosibacterium paludis]|uniref:Ribonuclease VapC n=1 Tax=Uliginosibacterium paludis TaxID=1615952 RepID=A0ABV2CSH4_9RHOO
MIIDSSALVAILLGEPEAEALAEALACADAPRISAANWLEAMIVITTRLGDAGTQALEELLDAAAIRIEATDPAQAAAAFAAWQRYGKGRHPAGLNFGDCFAYALARQSGEPLLFKGEDFGQTDVVAALFRAH